MRHIFYSLCFLLLISFNALSVRGTEDFKVTIYRTHSDTDCTSGYLTVNGVFIAYTLELPWKNNKEDVSSIPAGIYPAVLRYDHSDRWRIELRGVPGDRRWIQIHTGNEVFNSHGCILVGSKLSEDSCSIIGGTSRIGYAALKSSFYGSDNPASTPDKAVTVQIIDKRPACVQTTMIEATTTIQTMAPAPPTGLTVIVR